MGVTNFRFVIVGHGGDEAWLREHLPGAEFTGVLRGEALATAYANMDLFVFPSHTDTFGNVVLEALASGVPAIVTPDGGPRTIIGNSKTGREDDWRDRPHCARRSIRRDDCRADRRSRLPRRDENGRARLRTDCQLGFGV